MTAGLAGATTAKDVPAFVYTFRVTAVDVTATFTNGPHRATTQLRLAGTPKTRTMAWRGKRDHSNSNGVAATTVSVAGTGTYGNGDPNCARTFPVAARRPILISFVLVGALDPVVTRPGIYVAVRKFPLLTAYPDSESCGKALLDWYDNAKKTYPLGVLARRSFTLQRSRKERFEDGEAIDWTLRMTVRRVAYRPLISG